MDEAATLFLAGWLDARGIWAWPCRQSGPGRAGSPTSPACGSDQRVGSGADETADKGGWPTGGGEASGQAGFQGCTGAGDRSYPVVARVKAWSAGEAGGWEGFVVAGESGSGKVDGSRGPGCVVRSWR
jgi:hypothetical protein